MQSIKLTVTVGDRYLDHTSAIADELERNGLHVEHVSLRGGAIFGTADASAASNFLKVEGVADVRAAHDFHLA